ncbi:MAG TPA: PAS domain-containing protein [Pyrinomonadaceae bacterium]|nr:PAS domain-containing protein [Pyrinomonadaceae bacterium]
MNLTSMNLLGLFEIDESGTILYARAEPEDGAAKSDEVTGRNFFDLAPEQTVSELQQNIHRFVEGNQQANSFYVVSPNFDGSQRVKVLLGRIRYRVAGDPDTSILVHLRRV